MSPAQIAELVIVAAGTVPGLLALITDKPTDAEAIQHIREKVAEIPLHPARDAIEAHRRAVTETPPDAK